MTRVTARLHHRDPHPRLAQPARGELGEGGADAPALIIGIDGQHRDLSDLPFVVELRGDGGDDLGRSLSDPDVRRAAGEGVANRLAGQ
jgi:hypothetical protein